MGAAEIGRLWRTVRHLSADQWLWRAIVRGRLKAMERFPDSARARIERAAEKLPLADPGNPRLAALAEPVLALQAAVYGDHWKGAAEGRFRLLNRDFDFGSIDAISWRGDFGDGANPLRSNVLAYMGYAVPMLATGDAAALATAARLVRSLDRAGSFEVPGVFRDIWNAYSASHRLINLLSGLALYRQARGSGGPGDADAEADILGHARLCAAFVRANPERDIQFNHLMKNYVALSAYAAACDGVPAELRFLETAVPATVRQNVLPDGGHAERSPMYHALALLDVRVLAATGLFPDRWQPFLGDTLARMDAALCAMSLADGDIGLFNDSWFGDAPRTADLVALPDAPVRALPETGYWRLGGGGGDSVLFDCGPCGPDRNPAHAHADFLAVETTFGGARFLVDCGVPTYTAGDARDASRSAAAHNGPRLAGAEPLEFWSSFRVGRRGRAVALDTADLEDFAPLVAAGRQDGYARLGAELRRFVGLWPGNGLLIADLWTGKGSGAAAVGFLVDGGWTPSGDGFAQGDILVSIRALAGVLSPPRPVAFWPRFDEERPAHRLDVAPEAGGGPVRAAIWFGWGGGEPPDAAALESLFARLAAARNAPTRPADS